MPPLPVRARTVRWLLLLALTAPLAVGVTGIGDRQAGATSGSPAAVAVNFALRQLGKPYAWGADGPRSYDCSGLVQTAYRAAGVALPRVSRQQYHAGRHVRLTALRAGDLLFYADDPRNPRTIGHVGMYVGSGRMVEAPRPGRAVRIASIWRPGMLGRATRPAAGLRGLLPVQFGERSNAVAAVQRHLLGASLQREPFRHDVRRVRPVPGCCAMRVSNLVSGDAVDEGQERSSLILVARQRRDGGQAHLLCNVIC